MLTSAVCSSVSTADRILNGGEHEWTVDKQQLLLAAHWNQDRTKKRRHRKSHGKIDFTSLSRLISSRWKELPDGRKDFYRQVAAQDWERFQRELDEYKKPLVAVDSQAAPAAGMTPEPVGSRSSPAEESFHTVIG
jgi:HMG (high mobility group) box